MLLEKKPLGVEEMEAQTALELPDRDMMALLTVTIAGNNVLSDNEVQLAANVCANIGVVAVQDVTIQCDAAVS